MKNPLNEEVISAIRSYLPHGQNVATFLMNLLFLGKESIYRRLRGEIPFTYEEVVTISGKLGISIDNIISLSNSERSIFDFSFHKGNDWEELYYQKVIQFNKMFSEVRNCKRARSMFAMNYIPYAFSAFCKEFTRFRYFKWTHQTQEIDPDFKLSDLVIPERISNALNSWMGEDTSHMHTTYIFDDNVFVSVAKDISYFYKRGLISDEELKTIQADLIKMIEALEVSAKTGRTPFGNEMLVYLSPLDIQATCSHFEYDDNVCCHIQIYGIDVLQSYSPQACRAQKKWIEQIRKSSILITESAEMLRYDYFKRQREAISGIGQ